MGQVTVSKAEVILETLSVRTRTPVRHALQANAVAAFWYQLHILLQAVQAVALLVGFVSGKRILACTTLLPQRSACCVVQDASSAECAYRAGQEYESHTGCTHPADRKAIVCISCGAGYQLLCETAVLNAALVAGPKRRLSKKRKSVVLSDEEEEGAAESESNDSGSDWGKEGAAEAAGALLAVTIQVGMHCGSRQGVLRAVHASDGQVGNYQELSHVPGVYGAALMGQWLAVQVIGWPLAPQAISMAEWRACCNCLPAQ